jgi:hypothetical protein
MKKAKPMNKDPWVHINKGMVKNPVWPEDRQQVLAHTNYAGAPKVVQCIFVKRYSNHISTWENVFYGLDGGFYSYHGVFDWMPLPEPPKGK